MSGSRKLVCGALIAAGIVSAGIFLRNIGCFRRRTRQPEGAVRQLAFRCQRCGHEFAGYEVAPVPGAKQGVREFRCRRPGARQWVHSSDNEGVAEVKAVVCPKCGADMRGLLFLGVDVPPR